MKNTFLFFLLLVAVAFQWTGCASGALLTVDGQAPSSPTSSGPSDQPPSTGSQEGPQGIIRSLESQTMESGATLMASGNYNATAVMGSFSSVRFTSKKFEMTDGNKRFQTASLSLSAKKGKE